MLTSLSLGFYLLGAISSLQILQVTDFHLDDAYSTHGDPKEMCHVRKDGSADGSKLGPFGDYNCDSPELLVTYIVAEAKRLIPSPDLILWTGDTVPHIKDYDMDFAFGGLSKATRILANAYNTTPILPTFGNHDSAPESNFIEESSLYQETYEKLWGNYVGSENRDTFLRGGYFKYRIPNSSQVIVNMNTILYYRFLQNTLEEARQCTKMKRNEKFRAIDCAKTVHIAAHIAPGVFDQTPNLTWFTPYYNNRFLSLIEQYSTNVGWMLFGHHHTDTFHIIRDYKGLPINVAWMSPAVNPSNMTLPGTGARNPTFRVYHTDDYTGEILDFTTYSLNLERLNQNGNESARMEYSMKNAYSLKSLDPIEIDALIDEFDRDEHLFFKYITYNSAGWRPELPINEYRKAQFCSLRFADYPRYFERMEKENPSTKATNTRKIAFTISIFVVIFDFLFRIFI